MALQSEGKKYEIGVVTYDITSIPDLIDSRPTILHLLTASKGISVSKALDWVGFGFVGSGQ
jgi:hypothetical protein